MYKIISYILHPTKIFVIMRWKWFSRRLKAIGRNSWVGKNFSIIGPEFITIKDNFVGGINLKIQAYSSYHGKNLRNSPKVVIGNDVTFTDGIYISCINEVQIGDGVLCGGNVFITDNFHGKSDKSEMNICPNDRELYSKGRVIIGKNVWIGRNVCIMPNVTIGDNSVIGANAVVTKDLLANSIAVGVPAKVVKRIE